MKQTDHDASNREAAALILSAPEQYGPGMVAWAELWMQRHGQQAEHQRQSDGRQMEFGFEREPLSDAA